MSISQYSSIYKWLLYAIALLPLCILDGMILGQVDFPGGRPFLFPLAVSLVAILEGLTAGAFYGLYVGLFASLFNHGYSGNFIFILSFLGILVGFVFRFHIGQHFIPCLIGSIGALCALSLLRILFHVLVDGTSFVALIHISAPELLWSLAFFPLIYGLYYSVYLKVNRVSVR